MSNAQSKEEYLDRLAEGDEYFNNLREEARKEGKVVRYVGVVDVESGKVEAKLEKWVQTFTPRMLRTAISQPIALKKL